MAAVAPHPAPVEATAEHLEPYAGTCRVCQRDMLALDVDGREVVVEVAEVLPQFVCPSCAKIAAMGHRRSQCPRCGLTGWLGEPLPAVGVALDADGRARFFRIESGRDEGESVHVLHGRRCGA